MDAKATLIGAVLGAALVLIGQVFTAWTAYLSSERAMDVKM